MAEGFPLVVDAAYIEYYRQQFSSREPGTLGWDAQETGVKVEFPVPGTAQDLTFVLKADNKDAALTIRRFVLAQIAKNTFRDTMRKKAQWESLAPQIGVQRGGVQGGNNRGAQRGGRQGGNSRGGYGGYNGAGLPARGGHSGGGQGGGYVASNGGGNYANGLGGYGIGFDGGGRGGGHYIGGYAGGGLGFGVSPAPTQGWPIATVGGFPAGLLSMPENSSTGLETAQDHHH